MITIQVEELEKKFNNIKALDKLSFTIHAGTIFGFLGPSGSGKSTTINILTGQENITSGKVRILRKSSENLLPDDYLNIGILSESIGLYSKLTLYETLLFYAKFNNISSKYLNELLVKFELYNSKNVKIEKLSTGMRQRVLLIRAILHKPQILFLDEPTSGLDPKLKKVIHEVIVELKNEGITIFLTTHDMQEAEFLCDSIALLNNGKIIELGSPKEIVHKYSNINQVILSYQNGMNKIVEKKDLKNYLNEYVVNITTNEKNLEDIFLELTGEQLHD